MKIWVIQNERRDCVDQNEMTMEVENEEDEKFETHPNKDVIKRVSSTILITSINISSKPLYYDVINQVPIITRLMVGA